LVLKPDFDNLKKVLSRKATPGPVLFEFFMNQKLYDKLADPDLTAGVHEYEWGSVNPVVISAFANAGYDYATCYGSDMKFQLDEIPMEATISLNAGELIQDWDTFNKYLWPDADSFDYSRLSKARDLLPDGMKLVVYGPGGVLENAISLVGFDRLCLMLVDEADLTKEVFDEIGRRLERYYEICAPYDTVGALIVNDDWGFKTQTMLSPPDMRKYIFPWHKKIVETIHASRKPAILHSCGCLEKVMDDIIDDMKYDAKHSFEDAIEPVEEAYERWGDRIAILGGIDVDFICRSSSEQIKKRCVTMLERTAVRGGYALGTGNSVPEYVPDEKFLMLVETVNRMRN
jgi:uroporphyrinogen decarboxylase